MYNRAEASQLRQAFWTTFGQYMAPQTSAEGERINWINYKTGEKGIFFKMEAGTSGAYIGIELHQADADLQQLCFEQFEQYRTVFEAHTGETWEWRLHTTDSVGRTISKIYAERQAVNVMKKEDWPELITFFKPRMIALDAFWSEVKYAFEALR